MPRKIWNPEIGEKAILQEAVFIAAYLVFSAIGAVEAIIEFVSRAFLLEPLDGWPPGRPFGI